MDFISKIIENAKKHYKTIVLPEGTEERTILAADYIVKEKIADIILLGNPKVIKSKADELLVKHIQSARIIDPENNPDKEKYIDLMVKLRSHKGLTRDEAARHVENPLYLATLMIKNGEADGEVAGAENSTGNVLKPAFQLVKTAPGISIVSGAFIMILPEKKFGEEGILVFADCAVTPDPNEQQLAEIAISSAETAKTLCGFEPKVAMLSFSTKGSAKHEMVDKVINATQIAREKAPHLQIDGELQADAALIESVGRRKAPDSNIAGNANVLIFPTLETGNISYKLVQRMAHAKAVGPVLQGMAAPINDLSRGTSAENIIHTIAITASQAIK